MVAAVAIAVAAKIALTASHLPAANTAYAL